LIYAAAVADTSVKNARLDVTDNGLLTLTNMKDNTVYWQSNQLVNWENSRSLVYSTRKMYCDKRCRTCLPRWPKTITSLWSNGSDFSPYANGFDQSTKFCSSSGKNCLRVNNKAQVVFGDGVDDDILYKPPALPMNTSDSYIINMDPDGRIQHFQTSNVSRALWKNSLAVEGYPPFQTIIEETDWSAQLNVIDDRGWRIWSYMFIPPVYEFIYHYNGCLESNDGVTLTLTSSRDVATDTVTCTTKQWAYDNDGRIHSKTDRSMCLAVVDGNFGLYRCDYNDFSQVWGYGRGNLAVDGKCVNISKDRKFVMGTCGSIYGVNFGDPIMNTIGRQTLNVAKDGTLKISHG
jgi:hypothetical protein